VYATDLDGLARRADGGSGSAKVDFGAFERHSACEPGTPPPAGTTLFDWDGDRDVDASDAEAFAACMNTPGDAILPVCRVFDANNDCNVDQADHALLQDALSEAGNSPPALCVSPDTLNFSTSTTSLSFTVWNCGGGTLSYTVSADASWIAGVSPSSGESTGERDRITVTVNRAGLGDGRHVATVEVTGAGIDGTQTVNTVTFVGTSGGEMSAASQVNGVAPLAVFFDVLDPASGVVQPPDGDFAAWLYEWDFGDADSGAWSTSERSRNEAIGYVAAHVYDAPGTYEVTLHVTSPDGDTYEYQQSIKADNPADVAGWRTYYVASDGSDSNDGRSPSAPLRTFSEAMSKVGSSTSILFRRGDAFIVDLPGSITAEGPGIIGAYGDPSDPRPVLLSADLPFVFQPLEPHWRIMDLEMIGDATPSLFNAGIDGGAAATQFLLLERLTIHGYYHGVVTTYYPQPIVHDHVFIVDCEIFGQSNKGMFIGGTRQVVMGNNMHDSLSHVVRIWHARKAIVSENRLVYDFDPVGTVIKLHNATEVPNLPDGQYIIIAGNYIKGHTWDVTIGTQGEWANETIRDVVVERNFIAANRTTMIGIRVSAQNVVVRNNIGDLTGAENDMKFISVVQWGAEPPPTGARILNNNAYRSDTGSGWLLEDTLADTLVYNNLAWSPSGRVLIGGTTAQFSNNLTLDPHWVNPAEGDFRLEADSPAINTGRAAIVADDFFGIARPEAGQGDGNAQIDVGAIEYAP
jgi:hypothetical protein